MDYTLVALRPNSRIRQFAAGAHGGGGGNPRLPAVEGHSSGKLSLSVTDYISAGRGLLEAINWVIKCIIHVDCINELVVKPFIGDWQQVDKLSGEWDGLSRSLDKASSGEKQTAQTVFRGSWQGETAQAFARRTDKISGLLADAVSPSSDLAKALDALSDFIQQALDTMLDLLELIASLAVVIADLFTGNVVGAATEAMTNIDSAVEAINKAYTVLKELLSACDALNSCGQLMNNVNYESLGMLTDMQAAG